MRRDLDRLADMLEAIEAIERYLGEGRDAFDRNELLRVWYLRHLEVIGEAASRVSEALRSKHGQLPWREIIGMRNVLVHGYFDIDWDEVWLAASRDAPALREPIVTIMTDEAP